MKITFLRTAGALTGVAAAFALVGCSALSKVGVGPAYRPENFQQSAATLPREIQRIAVLPLSCDRGDFELAEARRTLEPTLQMELLRTRKFAVVTLDAELLRSCTGRATWSEEDPLPISFFGSLRNISGCDAVLFCRVTLFRAEAPLAVGWRLRLVDVRTQQTLWSADEVFDARDTSVVNGARRFEQHPGFLGLPEGDTWAVFNSPRRFGQYSVATLLTTLPQR